jgi:hypothetical protein
MCERLAYLILCCYSVTNVCCVSRMYLSELFPAAAFGVVCWPQVPGGWRADGGEECERDPGARHAGENRGLYLAI